MIALIAMQSNARIGAPEDDSMASLTIRRLDEQTKRRLRLRAAQGAVAIGRLVTLLPDVLAEAQMATHMLAEMANSGGLKLDRDTTEALALAQAKHSRAGRYAIVAGAAALVVIALALLF